MKNLAKAMHKFTCFGIQICPASQYNAGGAVMAGHNNQHFLGKSLGEKRSQKQRDYSVSHHQQGRIEFLATLVALHLTPVRA